MAGEGQRAVREQFSSRPAKGCRGRGAGGWDAAVAAGWITSGDAMPWGAAASNRGVAARVVEIMPGGATKVQQRGAQGVERDEINGQVGSGIRIFRQGQRGVVGGLQDELHQEEAFMNSQIKLQAGHPMLDNPATFQTVCGNMKGLGGLPPVQKTQHR